MTNPSDAPVLVACPDARPPAYQAVIGLHRARLLGRFLTAYYHRDRPALAAVGRRLAPGPFARVERVLRRRFDPEIPADRVRSAWGYDVAVRVEGRLAGRPGARRGVARWRTRRFDRVFARAVGRDGPGTVLAFSDVGTRHALPLCRARGVPVVLSVVHGDVREERALLAREAEASPEFFRLYLGDGALDRGELDWLHERRLAELELADLVLVPSEHIAATLAGHGTPRAKLRVIPYAADVRRFRPDPSKRHRPDCTFLFAGGVCQRKGIRYLLEAWRRVRRPGWRLQLLGPLPRDPGPLATYLDEVEPLGRVGHAEVPAVMAAADVFVFPSLFEGSAVVTYEALACGLPGIVTPSAGSVVRDGEDGLLVPPGDVEALAAGMERLGTDPALRAAMGRSARARAEAFDWPRYHAAVVDAVRSVLGPAGGATAPGEGSRGG
jgi:glycosyltransferase involved in cell wall biosynthesis